MLIGNVVGTASLTTRFTTGTTGLYIQFLTSVNREKSSGILKAKQKLGVTFNSDKLGGIDFTKFSKLTMCSA